MKGIDVSNSQGDIDWVAVKNSGIEFAIIRAGYGTHTPDARFVQNIEDCIKVGLHIGVYWFSYATSTDVAQEEADFFLKTIEPYKGQIDFPVAFDWEYASDSYCHSVGVYPDSQLITDMATAFLKKLESGGYYAILYSNNDYAKNKFLMDELSKFDLWLADYSGNADIPCGIQQVGSTGQVNGCPGSVDMDISSIDYPTIIKNKGLNGYDAVTQDNPPEVGEVKQSETDSSSNQNYETARKFLMNNNITTGACPQDALTREQGFLLLYNFYNRFLK